MTQNRKRRQRDGSAETLVNLHARDRWFTIAKVLLTISPLITLFYLQAASGSVGMNMNQLLRQNPEITVSFLASMCGPFMAYLLGFAQKHLHESDAAYAVTNLMLMLVAEALLRNAMYLIVLMILLYFVCDLTGMTPIRAFRQKWNNHFWSTISGGLTVLVFSAFCFFVSFRLGMI